MERQQYSPRNSRNAPTSPLQKRFNAALRDSRSPSPVRRKRKPMPGEWHFEDLLYLAHYIT